MGDDTLQVLVTLPVDVHEEGEGRWIAKVPDLGDVVGSGPTSRDARADAEEKASQAIADIVGNRDHKSPAPTAQGVEMTLEEFDHEGLADRIAAAQMEILRGRPKADAQTHAALRGSVLSVLQSHGS